MCNLSPKQIVQDVEKKNECECKGCDGRLDPPHDNPIAECLHCQILICSHCVAKNLDRKISSYGHCANYEIEHQLRFLQ